MRIRSVLALINMLFMAFNRAPLADRYFEYYSDAHRDYGRSFYFDVRVAF